MSLQICFETFEKDLLKLAALRAARCLSPLPRGGGGVLPPSGGHWTLAGVSFIVSHRGRLKTNNSGVFQPFQKRKVYVADKALPSRIHCPFVIIGLFMFYHFFITLLSAMIIFISRAIKPQQQLLRE